MLEKLRGFELERAARTVRFKEEPPWKLYEKAAADPGSVAIQRYGKEVLAVSMVDVAVELLWRAINDFDRHAEEDYLPLAFSRILGPSEDGEGLLVVQYFKRSGVGRWWVNEIRSNDELKRETGMWESIWDDRVDKMEHVVLPDEVQDANVRPIKNSEGAWLLIPMSEGCTVIEYFTLSQPGGTLGAFQWVGVSKTIRSNLQGMTRLARQYLREEREAASR